MKDVSQSPFSSGDPLRNPFRDDVFSGDTKLPGTPQIHEDATRRCIQSIKSMISGAGDSRDSAKRSEILLVSSPLAGYGKSHLIGRVSKSVLQSVTRLPLSLGPDPLWGDLLVHVVDYQSGSLSPKNPMVSCFDETAVRFLSLMIQVGISSGILEEEDCPVSVASLETDYRAILTDGTARKLNLWLKGKLALLSVIPLPADSRLRGFSSGDLLFWSRYFLKYLADGRRHLKAPVQDSEAENRERLIQYLRVSSSCRPLLVTADHLDSCHGSDTAGLQIAIMMTTIAEQVPDCLVMLSVNRDLWESVFEQKIPSAYLDRLNRDALCLESITPDEARLLVINRIQSQDISYHKAFLFAAALSGESQWDQSDNLSPRSVIRQAEDFWIKNGSEYCESKKPGYFSENGKIAPKPGNHLSQIPKIPSKQKDPFNGHSLIYPDRSSSTKSPAPIADEPNRLNQSFLDRFSGTYPSEETSNQISESQVDRPLKISLPPQKNPEKGLPEDVNLLGKYLLQLERKYSRSGKKLSLDLPSLEQFIKVVGSGHGSLVQNEISINGGNSHCLRWKLSDFSVWVGFEPIQNVYYYSHVLEKVLTDSTYPEGKMLCFSHGSERYDRKPYLATGLTDETLNRHFDIVHFRNDELAMIYAAIQLVRESSGGPYESEGLRIVLIRLAPLWNRMCHPVKENL